MFESLKVRWREARGTQHASGARTNPSFSGFEVSGRAYNTHTPRARRHGAFMFTVKRKARVKSVKSRYIFSRNCPTVSKVFSPICLGTPVTGSQRAHKVSSARRPSDSLKSTAAA